MIYDDLPIGMVIYHPKLTSQFIQISSVKSLSPLLILVA